MAKRNLRKELRGSNRHPILKLVTRDAVRPSMKGKGQCDKEIKTMTCGTRQPGS